MKRLDKPKPIGYTPSMDIGEYLSSIGRKGGSAKSERKTHASRLNGRKGGRPKNIKHLLRNPSTVLKQK